MSSLRFILAAVVIVRFLAPDFVAAQSDIEDQAAALEMPSGEAAAPQGAIPSAFDIDRYRFIWEKSPFTLSSAAEEPLVANFAANYALVGQGFIGGKPFVRILDKASQQRFTITEGEPSNGIELVTLESSDDPLQSSAKVRKGAETGIIRFDPALLSAASVAPPNMPVPQQQQPGIPPNVQPPNAQPPGQPPAGNNIPTPRRRRIIIPSSR